MLICPYRSLSLEVCCLCPLVFCYFFLEVNIMVFVKSLEVVLIVSVNDSKTFFISS